MNKDRGYTKRPYTAPRAVRNICSMTSEKRKHLYRSIKIVLERHKIFLILLIPHIPQQRNVHSTYAIDTRTSLIRRRYEKRVEDTTHIRHTCHTYVADTKGTLYIRHGYVACYPRRTCGVSKYELRIYGVSATLLSYVPRMCDVCTAYRTCHVRQRLRIFKCTHKKRSTSAYELRILTYVRRTPDGPFVY